MSETTQALKPPCHANRWRAATIACLLAMAIALATGMSMFEQFKAQIGHLQTQLQTTAQIKYIAVLRDSNQAPAMLITHDPHEGALQIQRLNSVTEGRSDSMHLWTLSPHGKPQSLGVLESKGKTLQLKASDTALADVSELAISVENKGGAEPNSGPRLPYLFTGAVLQKAL